MLDQIERINRRLDRPVGERSAETANKANPPKSRTTARITTRCGVPGWGGQDSPRYIGTHPGLPGGALVAKITISPASEMTAPAMSRRAGFLRGYVGQVRQVSG